MPIKDPTLYPKNWPAISAEIRFGRAQGRCECVTECGLHAMARCTERHGEKALYAKGKVILTVAHLNHKPADVRRENLKAMCQRCHNRYDMPMRKVHAAETREIKKGPRFPGI